MKSNSVSLLRKKLRIMATKTFEELKQLAIQIRDEKTNKQNTATRVGTAMLEHINKLEQDYYDKTNIDEQSKNTTQSINNLNTKIDKRTTEYNVSVNHPTSGTDGTNRYDLAGAIAQVPAELRKAGLTVSFLNSDGDTEKWEFGGGSWEVGGFSQVGAGRITGLSNSQLCLENANSLNPKFIDDWGWQKGNRDYTTGVFKDGPYYVSDIVDVEGCDFEFSTNEKADFVCSYSVDGGTSFKNTNWVNNFQIQGFTHIFIILADAENHYIGPSDINVYQSSQEKFYKNVSLQEFEQSRQELLERVNQYDSKIKHLEVNSFGGNEDVNIPFPFNPCLFAKDGKDITSDVYPDAYATDYLDLTEYNSFVLNGACILSFPYAVYYDSNKEILSTLSPGGPSQVKKFDELVLNRSDYPDGARYIRFHSYSKVSGQAIEYSCIGDKKLKGFEKRIEELENNFWNITSPSIYKVIN